MAGMDYDAEAARRLPGPDYYQVLRWIHAELKPAVYVEIGVMYGESLRIAAKGAEVIGIDPNPLGDAALDPRVVRMTSREFFAAHRLSSFDFAFLDGEHLFEQVLEDLLNLEPFATEASVVAVHDTIPLNEETATRVRTTDYYTGDVWKAPLFLSEYRPELEMVTIPAAPSGLALIRGLRGRWQAPERSIEQFAGLNWSCYREVPRRIENTRAAVVRWLRRQ